MAIPSKVKALCLLLGLLFSEISFGQIKYEQGYFISNDDKRTDCLIKNNDWSNNPIEFQYRLLGDTKPLTGSIQGVKGIWCCKFKVHKVKG